jgi:outer membrane protein
MKWLSSCAVAAALLVPLGSAQAGVLGKYRIRAGAGVQAVPSFPGADNLDVSVWPKVSVARDDHQFGFVTPDDSLGISLFSSDGFSAGPVARLRSSRDEEDVGAPVGDVRRAIELGGFVQQYVGDSFRLRAELRKGVRGHHGLVGSASADYVIRDGDKYLFSIGPRVRYGDADFTRTYFGVSDAAAAVSPLQAYRPGGGINSVGLTSTFNYALGGRWGVFGYAEYSRLVGDARHSPIVTELGSPNQFSAGAGISYTFDFTL